MPLFVAVVIFETVVVVLVVVVVVVVILVLEVEVLDEVVVWSSIWSIVSMTFTRWLFWHVRTNLFSRLLYLLAEQMSVFSPSERNDTVLLSDKRSPSDEDATAGNC